MLRRSVEPTAKSGLMHRKKHSSCCEIQRNGPRRGWPQRPRGPRGLPKGFPPKAAIHIVRNGIRNLDDNAAHVRWLAAASQTLKRQDCTLMAWYQTLCVSVCSEKGEPADHLWASRQCAAAGRLISTQQI